MKYIKVIILLICSVFGTEAQDYALESVFSMETTSIYTSKRSVIYKDSIIYSVGSFDGSISSNGTVLQTNYSRGIYLLKTTVNNEFVWLKKIAENDYQVVQEPVLAIDLDSTGNVLVGVGFRDKLYYNGDSTVVVDGENNKGIVFLKLDNENTGLIWHKFVKSDGFGENGVKFDNDNNILVSGNTNYNFFLTKFNSNGDSLWTKTGGASNSNVALAGGDIIIDEENNYYCSGALTTSNIIYFDQIHPVFNVSDFGKYGNFLAKYDELGQIQWLKCLFASSEEIQFSTIKSMDLIDGKVLIGGGFNSNYLRSSPNEGSLGSINEYGKTRGFLIMYDVNGNRIWSKITHTDMDNFGGDGVMDVTFIDTSSFYVTSSFTYQLAVLGDTLSGGMYGNLLIEKYSADGNVLNYFLIDGSNQDGQIGFYTIDNIIYFIGVTNSNPLVFSNNPYSFTNSTNFFIAKLQDNSLSSNQLNNESFSLYPNPTTGKVKLTSEITLKGQEVLMFNSIGQLLKKQVLEQQFSNEIQLPEESGIYFLRINQEIFKVIKQ